MDQDSSPAVAAEVPHYFLCPISLEVMRDPVTLATGITYDRASIERWLDDHATCPVTRRALAPQDQDATPNHTLRRLIQAWCAAHEVERFPTPRPPLDSARVAALLDDARHGGADREAAAVREIKAVVAQSDRNRRCVEATPGAVEFLASVVRNHCPPPSTAPNKDDDDFLDSLLDSPTSTSSTAENALGLLYSFKPSEKSLARVLDARLRRRFPRHPPRRAAPPELPLPRVRHPAAQVADVLLRHPPRAAGHGERRPGARGGARGGGPGVDQGGARGAARAVPPVPVGTEPRQGRGGRRGGDAHRAAPRRGRPARRRAGAGGRRPPLRLRGGPRAAGRAPRGARRRGQEGHAGVPGRHRERRARAPRRGEERAGAGRVAGDAGSRSGGKAAARAAGGRWGEGQGQGQGDAQGAR